MYFFVGWLYSWARKSRVAEAKKKKGKRIMPKGGYF
jgi:hypothetical protein